MVFSTFRKLSPSQTLTFTHQYLVLTLSLPTLTHRAAEGVVSKVPDCLALADVALKEATVFSRKVCPS